MRTPRVVGLGSLLVFGMAIATAHAQRGVGDQCGIAQSPAKPEVMTLSGKLIEIRIGACEATTGGSRVGTHIVLQAADGKKSNIHLGPADVLGDRVAKLAVGQDIAVQAFRTEKLKSGDFVARSLTSGTTRIELRDAEFRPFWSHGGVSRADGAAGRRGQGLGHGPHGWMGGEPARGGGGRGMGCRGACGGRGAGSMGMSAAEHSNIAQLLSRSDAITRKVEPISGGVRTTTTTKEPGLVESLRAHVRQMASHLEEGRPVRMWDPAFRDIFEHHDEIRLVAKDIEGGIEVTETSENPEVVPLIRAHARKVDDFVAGGHAAARPPWAGSGRGRTMRGL